ncbi:hypothetical protein LOC68_14465 [Blastopirellula sp. JC732]|uniref:Uncharacterized protein n=1 Tax=Blastopirellula sediminis TaxID=2894196 RepID=A0A9X1SGP5_9BACT|nr:hypothetical protein [Blastopirellula sediminis]MCC9607114.1 hypothetical protein [Blastopirellula sediminis]MCC9629593.1 hypothetical protein [Blastopirellula sediminis]
MNAIALVLCTVALGAGARETIPTPRALFEVINNSYAIDKFEQIEFSEDGVTLNACNREGDENARPAKENPTPVKVQSQGNVSGYVFGEYQLKIVTVPGTPNFLLAGYESTSDDPYFDRSSGTETRFLRHCFCVLIDTDRNIVVPLDDPSQRLFLNKEQVDVVQLQCGAIWSDYLQHMGEQSSVAPFLGEYKAFRRQFIQLPPLEVAVKVAFLGAAGNPPAYPPKASDWDRVIGMAAAFELSADDRKVSYSGSIEMQKLLSTTIAQSAADYFAKPPVAETAQPISISE